MSTNIPGNLKYTKEHEWALVEGDTITVGITDFAQSALGDIVFVELPAVGEQLERGNRFGTVESVKAVEEIYAPLSGTVLAVNQAVIDQPEQLHHDPYGAGWLLEIPAREPRQFDDLIDAASYTTKLEGAA